MKREKKKKKTRITQATNIQCVSTWKHKTVNNNEGEGGKKKKKKKKMFRLTIQLWWWQQKKQNKEEKKKTPKCETFTKNNNEKKKKEVGDKSYGRRKKKGAVAAARFTFWSSKVERKKRFKIGKTTLSSNADMYMLRKQKRRKKLTPSERVHASLPC